MKLYEKFLPYSDNERANKEANAMNCADEAKRYAVEFANWIDGYAVGKSQSNEDLLKIFNDKFYPNENN